MGDELFVKLRDCFTAGYTLPQYCIDNGIKRPLFVSEKKYELFLWEVYVQFHYDKRMTAQFCFIDANQTAVKFSGSIWWINGTFTPLDFSATKLDNFDAIILLTKETVEVTGRKIIRFAELEWFFIKRTYTEIPLLHFLQRYPKVKLFLTNFPGSHRFKGGNEFNSQLPWNWRKIIQADKSGTIKTPWDKFGYNKSQILDILSASLPEVENTVKTNFDGSTNMMTDDGKNPFLGIRNGKRMTTNQPEHFKNKIYFVGTCHQYGVFAPFDKTIESYLQKMLNEANLPYRVENQGQLYRGRFQDMFYNLNKLNPSINDIIFVFVNNWHSINNNIPFCDVSDAFDPPHDFREIYCVPDHVNELGYKLLAEKYFKFLTENNFFHNVELNYQIPPPNITDMVYLLGSSRAA